MGLLKPSVAYFALVFAAGFALGVVRVLWLVPTFGERAGELIESPFMLAAVFFAARFTVSRWGQTRIGALGFGLLALAMLVLAEIFVVLSLRDQTLAENLAGRDPVSGSVYAASLVLFGLMPWLLFRTRRTD